MDVLKSIDEFNKAMTAYKTVTTHTVTDSNGKSITIPVDGSNNKLVYTYIKEQIWKKISATPLTFDENHTIYDFDQVKKQLADRFDVFAPFTFADTKPTPQSNTITDVVNAYNTLTKSLNQFTRVIIEEDERVTAEALRSHKKELIEHAFELKRIANEVKANKDSIIDLGTKIR